MSSRREIESVARRVNETTNELKRRRASLSREVSNIHSWWAGKASTVFQEEYQEINLEMSKTFQLLADLEERLRYLGREVQRAEDERRRKREEMRSVWVW